jgi:uncharacterized protein YegJ (DUF2314 family)
VSIYTASYANGTFTGIFMDDAFEVQGSFKKGQPARCDEKDISDWLYLTADGKEIGGFTNKVLEEMAAKNPQNRQGK